MTLPHLVTQIPAISTPHFALSLSRYPENILQSAEVGVPKNESKSAVYENRTKSVESEGLERNGPRERISASERVIAVRRFVREARGYWRVHRAKSRQRKLFAEGLAVGGELTPNLLRVPQRGGAYCSALRRTWRREIPPCKCFFSFAGIRK